MNESQFIAHIEQMKKQGQRFTWIITIFFIVLVCMECYRLFVLDSRVTYLWKRVSICEGMPRPYSKHDLKKVQPGAYVPADSTYNNVAGDPNHGE